MLKLEFNLDPSLTRFILLCQQIYTFSANVKLAEFTLHFFILMNLM